MNAFPKLPNAPIQEALLDIRVQARQGLHASEFDELFGQLHPAFSVSEVMRSMRAKIRLEPTGEATTRTSDAGETGRLFKSAEGNRIVQCRVDGMTVNMLRPYSSFEDLYEVFSSTWALYREVARPTALTRIAVRYINRFEIPKTGNLIEFVATAPATVVDDSYISGFTQSTVHGFSSRGETVILNTALELPLDGGSPNMVLDIDAFREVDVDMSNQDLASAFTELRHLKNSFFFKVIGPRAMEKFK